MNERRPLDFGGAVITAEKRREQRRRLVMRARRRRERARRRAYLLPSIFTVANMLLGFYAVVLGLRGRFAPAALLIFAAAILDSLDGRIARMTNTESDFGREYDSLADLVTFGMAPSLLAYLWGLEDLGRAGWLAPLFFLVCTATRLARFNVQTRKVDKRYFVGLPAPAAAGALASILFVVPDRDWKPWFNLLLMGVLLTLALLMVSTFRYPSFKQIDLRRGWSYRVVLPIAAVVLLAAYHPPAFLVSASSLYAASGPWLWLRGKLRHPPEAHPHEVGNQGPEVPGPTQE